MVRIIRIRYFVKVLSSNCDTKNALHLMPVMGSMYLSNAGAQLLHLMLR